MVKALFLDRDGTINVDKGYVYRQEDFALIDGIIELCQNAQKQGYKIIIITNQSGIGRGYFTEEDFQKITAYMIDLFKQNGIEITDVFHCPDLESPDRKPNIGMFIKAKEKYGIDMASSISIGDKERDVIAGQNACVGRNYLFNPEVKSFSTEENSLLKDLSPSKYPLEGFKGAQGDLNGFELTDLKEIFPSTQNKNTSKKDIFT